MFVSANNRHVSGLHGRPAEYFQLTVISSLKDMNYGVLVHCTPEFCGFSQVKPKIQKLVCLNQFFGDYVEVKHVSLIQILSS